MLRPALRACALSLAIAVPTVCGGDGEGSPTTPVPDEPLPPNQLPTASFTVSVEEGNAPLVVTFNAGSSTDPDGSIVSYAWTFGDGATATGAQAIHTFSGVGAFRVELSITDDRGGEDSSTDFVFVSSPPGDGPNRIRGSVWFDRDPDGLRNGGEPPLHRFPVFLDDDGDGSRGEGEALAFTAQDGTYEISGLDADRSYTVTQALPFGWTNTAPGPAPAPSLDGAAPIINGEDASIDEFPFQVALMLGDFQFCGGTLVNSRYVLTAAHCVAGRVSQDVDVLVGTADLGSGGERVGTSAIRIHPEFSATLDADIALLRLDRSLLRHRVFLQTRDQPSLSTPGDTATVIGWGQIGERASTSTLQRVEVPIITNDECGKIAGAFFGGIGPRTICAGGSRLGRGACFGDSGGPLLVPYGDSWAEIGVVSFGVNVDQCGNIPDAYSRVSELYDYVLGVARIEASGTYLIDWSGGPVAQADFGNFH